MLKPMKRYPNSDLADRIRSALEESGTSQADLARACRVTDQAVYDWVKTGRVAKQHLPTISALTGKSLEYLLIGLKPWRRVAAIALPLISIAPLAECIAHSVGCILCKIARGGELAHKSAVPA